MRPYAVAQKAISEAIYPEGHPYRHLTIGSHEDLQAATLDDVKDFFREWRGPNNATLVVVGDFDPQQTKAWIEKLVGSLAIKAGSEVREFTLKPQPATTVMLEDNVSLHAFTLVGHRHLFSKQVMQPSMSYRRYS